MHGLYDWANSVYSLVIATVFPIYYETVTSINNGMVQFLGHEFNNSSLLSILYPFHFFDSGFNVSYILLVIQEIKRFLQFFVI
jgi:UMF1 family MFS transporter